MELGSVAEHEPATEHGEREAAVLAGVIDRPAGPHVLFTKRSEHLEDHPGQMSFPGGGREPVDADRRETALREAHEEVGLHPEEVTIVGRLDDIQTVTAYAVRPFVGHIPDRTYEPSDSEVAEIAILPLSGLCEVDNYETECRTHPTHGSVRLHYFHVDGYTVWGATARVLVQLLELATDWDLPPGPECQTVESPL
ncbi:MAG: CoA pyrophosphatase [Halorhabdus sp.]